MRIKTNRSGEKQQYQFRAEARVRACLDAYIQTNPHIPPSELLNIIVAHGLKSLGIDAWELPEPSKLRGARRRNATIANIDKIKLKIPKSIPLFYPVEDDTEAA